MFYAFVAKPVFYRCSSQYAMDLTVNNSKQTMKGSGLYEVVLIK
jgi:hypothetical protein